MERSIAVFMIGSFRTAVRQLHSEDNDISVIVVGAIMSLTQRNNV